ncbi:MAG: TIM barrel protein [Armatimonadetes bacterium]|nr:TIM barrel protein [Armatimonadota bacterium]NIO76630.1 TIM barrel protein [Armatimonadota bacterium]NIO96439.1 TIM barrel protein [Armatimonadota bacterium]
MKIACYSLILGKGYTVPAAAKILSRLGYDGVGWRVRDDFHLPLSNMEEKAAETKAVCDNAGLKISALYTYLPLRETERISAVLQAAATMGCSAVRVLAPQYDGSVHYASLLEQAREDLGRLEPLSRQTKVKAMVALHMGNIVPSASAALRLVEGFSPDCIGVIFDPGNMVCHGRENWKMGIQILGSYLAHVHVRNGGWFYSEESGWRFGWTPLQKGIADWAKIVSTLMECGYEGWLSIEDFADIPIEQKLEEDITLVRQYIEAAAQPAQK